PSAFSMYLPRPPESAAARFNSLRRSSGILTVIDAIGKALLDRKRRTNHTDSASSRASSHKEVRIRRLCHAAFRIERHGQTFDLGSERKVLDRDRGGAGLGHVKDAGALRFGLIGAQDPELVTLVGGVCG